MISNDPHNLQRFLDAQTPIYEEVCRELRAGKKKSHWMWFIFPQLRGLGSSPTAMAFGVSSLAEARAFLEHPILGARIRECTRLVNEVENQSIHQILGYPDDLKFRSSMTLFASVGVDAQIFKDALQKYFAGEPDPLTLELL